MRKWSAVEFKEIGTVVVGAVEKIIQDELPEEIKTFMDQGMRVIGVGHTSKEINETKLPKLKPLMIIVLSDTIRDKLKKL